MINLSLESITIQPILAKMKKCWLPVYRLLAFIMGKILSHSTLPGDTGTDELCAHGILQGGLYDGNASKTATQSTVRSHSVADLKMGMFFSFVALHNSKLRFLVN